MPATDSRVGRMAWSVAALTILLYVGQILVLALTSVPTEGGVEFVWPAPFMAMALIGALVAARYPRNATGWLFLGAGVLMMSNAFAQAYARAGFSGAAEVPAGELMAWLAFWSWIPATLLIALGLVVFPTGRPPSPGWRWVVGAMAGVAMAVPVVALPTLGVPGPTLLSAPTPTSVPGGELLGFLAGPSILALPIGLVALVARYRRADLVERLQLKWVVFAASLLGLATVILGLLPVEDPISHPLGGAAVLVGMTAIPVAAGVAILRYRLYEIDRIVRRTVSYGALTALLAGTYVGLVFLLRELLPLQGDLPVGASTLVVAALFNPLRRRVQKLVDSRFNRSRYDAVEVVEAFGRTLRNEVDLVVLAGDLRAVAVHALQPAHVSVWLKDGGARASRLST